MDDDIFNYDFTMGGGDQTYFGGNTLGDTSWIDNFDWSGALDNLDFSGLNLGGLDLSGIDLGGSGYDTGAFDLSGLDLGGAGYDTGAFGTYVGGTEGFADASDEVGGANYLPGYIMNPDGSYTPYGFDKGYYGEGESHGVDERGMEYWIAPDGSVMYSKYVDEKGYERNPDGTPTGRTIEDIVGPGNVTVPSGRVPTGINTSGIGGAGGSGGAGSSGSGTGGGKGGDTSKSQNPLLNKDNAMLMALLGGLLGLLSKGSAPKGPVGYQGGIPKYTAKRVPGRGVEYTKAAQGGLMGLKQGQYLDGATDGMADKIQTSIEGKQPARLSHGEFVVSADVVSALGSGNSDAGAQVLYDMMDRVRQHAHGHKKQIKPVNKSKVLPA